MIEELRIRGLGVIEEAVLPLGPGLSVITGETGAGKTMVLTGMGLLLGRRSDSGLVRAGCDRAEAEGIFVVPEGWGDRLDDLGAVVEGGCLIAGRSVSAEGRSRGFLGGRSVPVATLAEVIGDLVTVHGQSDQQRLVQPARQRELLDSFAGSEARELLDVWAIHYGALADLSRELRELRDRGRDRALEMDSLTRALEEIDAAQIVEGEEVEIDGARGRLSHVEALREAALQVVAAIGGDDDGSRAGVLGELKSAVRELERAAELDPTLAPHVVRLRDASVDIADVLAEVSAYESGLDADPEALERLEERKALLKGLMRRYGSSTSEILAWAESARQRVGGWTSVDDEVSRLEDAIASEVRHLRAVGARLTATRREAAGRLEALVSEELAGLAMTGAAVEVRVEARTTDAPADMPRDLDGQGYGRTGCDAVSMWLTSHSGANARPLGGGASGGELSRIMLALEVALMGADLPGTLIFDEVDAGVGGRAAVEVGRRLAALARSAQVIVVTHLPQVAAFADRHLVVVKSENGGSTQTQVRAVEGEERLREIARMLAGFETSEAAATHAQELLRMAHGRDTPDTPGATKGPARRRATRA